MELCKISIVRSVKPRNPFWHLTMKLVCCNISATNWEVSRDQGVQVPDPESEDNVASTQALKAKRATSRPSPGSAKASTSKSRASTSKAKRPLPYEPKNHRGQQQQQQQEEQPPQNVLEAITFVDETEASEGGEYDDPFLDSLN